MTDTKKRVVAFEVVDNKTREVVHTVQVDLKYSESMIDRLEMGLLRKTDLDRFFVREVRK